VAVETVDFEVDAGDSLRAAASDSPLPTVPPQRDETPPEEGTPPAISSAAAQAQVAPSDPLQDVQTLGELLQQAREARGLSLEATSARTRISTHMLRHLENDRFGEFAAEAYVKGFLRNYGGFLGLDTGMLLRRYEAISGRAVERDPEILELEMRPRPRRRKKLRRFGVLLLLLLLSAALGWVFWGRGAARLGLRPKPGLEQIEDELRDSRRPLPVPRLVPNQPAVLLPDESTTPPAEAVDAALPASEQAPPSQPVPRPLSPTERRDPGADAAPKPTPPPPPPSQPLEDLAPEEQP
jgi:cytoskeletal protein RodZ